MPKRIAPAQADLFGSDPQPAPEQAVTVDAAFVQRIRDELHATLAMVAAADRDPWATPTQGALAQLRFQSIASTWLPAGEAAELWRRFDAELLRIYGPDDDEADSG
jgi:hypothetical protein